MYGPYRSRAELCRAAKVDEAASWDYSIQELLDKAAARPQPRKTASGKQSTMFRYTEDGELESVVRSVRFKPHVLAAADELAKATGTSTNALVNIAVARYTKNG